MKEKGSNVLSVTDEIKQEERIFAKFPELSHIPLVTIAVFCYKNAQLLLGMIDSILQQNYPRIQLIISDDGSDDFETDEVLNYISEAKASNIEEVIVRKNTQNIGTVQHVTQVIPLMKGEFFSLTAADDRFVSSTDITACVRKFLANPDGKWLVARCKLVTADYRKTIGVTPFDKDIPFFEKGNAKSLFSRWSRRGLAVPCCMMFRSETMALVGGVDQSYKYLEDWPLVLKLLRNNYAPIFLNRAISVHSVGGVTNSNERYGIAVREDFFKDKFHLMEKEVLPYLELLSSEDQSALKKYRREIMDRNFFLDIERMRLSRREKMLIFIKSPSKFVWLIENKVELLWKKIKYKQWLVGTQICLMCSAILLACSEIYSQGRVLGFLGMLEMIGAIFSLVLLICIGVTKFLCHIKAKERRKLVM